MVGFMVDKNPVERVWKHIILESIHENNTAVSFIHNINVQYNLLFFKHKALTVLSKDCMKLSLRKVIWVHCLFLFPLVLGKM